MESNPEVPAQMSLRVAVQMDPIEKINIASDTTFLLMMAAQARGHQLWVYEPRHLSLEDGRVSARARKVTLKPVKGDHVTAGDYETLDLADDIDVVLMRQDPPFDIAYITATYFLETIHPNTLVVNNPTSVRDAPEKRRATRRKGRQSPTLVSSDWETLDDFFGRAGIADQHRGQPDQAGVVRAIELGDRLVGVSRVELP